MGRTTIIPVPFDPRLISSRVSAAVAQAAIKTGVARREVKMPTPITTNSTARLDPSALLFQRMTASVRANPKRVAFAEGEEESVIRAATAFQNSGLGKALLVGREDVIKAGLRRAGIDEHSLEIRVPHCGITRRIAAISRPCITGCNGAAILYRDCMRMVRNDRNCLCRLVCSLPAMPTRWCRA